MSNEKAYEAMEKIIESDVIERSKQFSISPSEIYEISSGDYEPESNFFIKSGFRKYFRHIQKNKEDRFDEIMFGDYEDYTRRFVEKSLEKIKLETLEEHQVYNLSEMGVMPVEAFYTENSKDVLPSHIWFKLFIRQFFVRGDDETSESIMSDILKDSAKNYKLIFEYLLTAGNPTLIHSQVFEAYDVPYGDEVYELDFLSWYDFVQKALNIIEDSLENKDVEYNVMKGLAFGSHLIDDQQVKSYVDTLTTGANIALKELKFVQKITGNSDKWVHGNLYRRINKLVTSNLKESDELGLDPKNIVKGVLNLHLVLE